MKRYIIALVALLLLTACRIGEGNHPDKNAVDRLLFNRTSNILHEANLLSSFAIYTDVYMSGDESEKRLANAVLFKDYLITEAEDGLIFKRVYSDGTMLDKYKITTGGKRLSEGVKWQLTALDKLDRLSAQYETRSDLDGGFYIEKVNKTPYYGYYDVHPSKISYHFDFKYDVSMDRLAVISNISGLCSIQGFDYTIDFTIQSSSPAEILNCNRIDNGVIDIKYKDLVLNTEERTTAVIKEGLVSYE